MPGFCTSDPYGFTDLSTDITMFDQGLSKTLVVVKDFRVSEMSMDGNSSSGETSSTEVDPADTTSVVHWNYALDVMTPEDISQVLGNFLPQDRLVEVSGHSFQHQAFMWLICGTDSEDSTAQISWSNRHRAGSGPRGHQPLFYFAFARQLDPFKQSPLCRGNPR